MILIQNIRMLEGYEELYADNFHKESDLSIEAISRKQDFAIYQFDVS